MKIRLPLMAIAAMAPLFLVACGESAEEKFFKKVEAEQKSAEEARVKYVQDGAALLKAAQTRNKAPASAPN